MAMAGKLQPAFSQGSLIVPGPAVDSSKKCNTRMELNNRFDEASPGILTAIVEAVVLLFIVGLVRR
jgi:hypothetical protein